MITDTPADPDSGVAGTEWQTAHAMRDLGHEIDALWADDLGPRRIRHGNLHYALELPLRIRSLVASRFALATYDVVHVSQPHGFKAAEWLSAHHPGVPFIHRSHGLELRAERDLAHWRRLYDADTRSLVRRGAAAAMAALLRRHTWRTVAAAAGHIVYATQCATFLESELGVPADRVTVIPAAAPRFMLDSAAPAMDGERLRTVLHASQFAFFKAPMIVARAMNALAAADPEIRFIWLCERRHHGAVQEHLAPAVRSRLELLAWGDQETLRQVYDRSGFFLFPSFYEGFGKVFLEAMARGCIVVASDIAGAHDVISHGENGFLCPPGDVSAIARSVSSVRHDPQSAMRISSAAAATARLYTWERAARMTFDFYEHLRQRLAHIRRTGRRADAG